VTAEAPVALDVRADADRVLPDVMRHLWRGGVIGYPTETVYGLGGAATPTAVARVRALKSRDTGKPLIVLVPSVDAVSGLRWTEPARRLARDFWPGPLTLVLEDPRGIFPPGVRHEDTHAVGVRVSPHPLVARLVAELGGPLTSTSLNAPGEHPAASGAEALEVVRRLGGRDVLVLDGGTLASSKPSSVVDCTGSEPVLIREGAVPTSSLRRTVPDMAVSESDG
jgi:tRNA threonylcarbamoyl adenosine modification protein (Sua5/YciO/YrdC/YwlC family)